MTILLPCIIPPMPRKKSVEIRLSIQEKMLLGRWNKGFSWSRREAIRADIVSRAARGQTNYRIAIELGVSRNTVKQWRYRFARERIAGLKTKPIPGRPKKIADSAVLFDGASNSNDRQAERV